jgi:hypothetical protein
MTKPTDVRRWRWLGTKYDVWSNDGRYLHRRIEDMLGCHHARGHRFRIEAELHNGQRVIFKPRHA